MDLVEIARRTAADLHGVAVSKGFDPTDPYAFAKGVAEERGLGVEHAAPGSASLSNGRATFIPEDDLIVHEDRGSAFDGAPPRCSRNRPCGTGRQDGRGCPGSRADEGRQEPSPVGLDRVIDYGRRQRREVQMDLFARELLLPRPLMRKMHLEMPLRFRDRGSHESSLRRNCSAACRCASAASSRTARDRSQ